MRGVYHRLGAGLAAGEVVAVEGDVDVAERDLGAGADQLPENQVQAGGEDCSASVDADHGQAGRIGVLLDDLVGDPPQGPPQIVALEHDRLTQNSLLTGLAGPD